MNLSQMVIKAKRLEVWTCTSDATLGEVGARMVNEDISTLVVVDEGECLIGIITRTDLLRARLEAGLEWRNRPAREFMSQEVISVPATSTLEDVARLLIDRHIHRVVVVRSEETGLRPLAVISTGDLLYHLAKKA
ncbi:MAG: CBS domain-containing protein [bacterium]|nr:CBS domain-containing protein [bacterium]